MKKHMEYLMKYTGEDFFRHEEVLDWEAEDKDDESTYFFSWQGAEIGCVSVFREPHRINLFNVYVEPEYRRRGFATEMLFSVMEDLKDCDVTFVLQVSGDNEAAMRLYDKCGFAITESVEITE